MLDVKELERRWLKYKVKSYAPYGAGGVIIIAVTAGILSWLLSPEQPAMPDEANKTIVTPSSSPAAVLPKPEEENTTILEPAMDFVQTFQTSLPEQESETAAIPKPALKASVPAASLPPPKVLAVPEISTPAEGSSAVQQSASPVSRKMEGSLSINRNESKLDIDQLKQRFKETSNANLGLFIARYYYDHGNYTEAYNYALRTNAVNNKIDDSWIIFSKSLVKLGKTDQAKKTLLLYIQQSNSESARGLLESIEKGTFK